ncbi:enolase [Rhodococcus sp. 15-649-2-2]|uniref:mandelate racemase/muconate lactonizing enzyme family protein n=1 Tax=Rhodococcus sp. 15-649-2-2 TaxID=2023140 RepID=UPI000B9A2FB4|nr:enolase C-terminal domain-like protein [Rhodococcus sp. 15-649-2-2]OZE74211.1 enolase [Rhodococcus sp. 15-649-2-2]
MKIEKIEAIPYVIPFRKPLKFASGEVTVADHVLIRVHTSDGVIGIADAPPRPYTYGETQRSIVAVIDDVFGPALVGQSILERERISAILDRTVHNDVAKGAIDIAIWDAVGITLGVSVSKLLGGYSDHLRVSHMLGFHSAQEVLDEARYFVDEHGIRAFKIKVGRRPMDLDLELCAILARELDDDIELYVDANRGWTANEAIAALPALADSRTSLFEEPCDARETMGRRRLVATSTIPIVGDESVPRPGDVSRELMSGGCDAVSIKTARGGFTNSVAVLGLCQGMGVDVLMGNQIDTQIGSAATVAFGSAFKATHSRPGELSNYLDLADDLIAEPLDIRDGVMKIPVGPGVGVSVDPDKLSRYRTDK